MYRFNYSSPLGVNVSRGIASVKVPCAFTGSLWDDMETVKFLYDVHKLQSNERERYSKPSYERWDGAVLDLVTLYERAPLSQNQQDDRFSGRYCPPSLDQLDF